MTRTASLETSKKLFKLSKWDDCEHTWLKHSLNPSPKVYATSYINVDALSVLSGSREYKYPAYDSDYLLGKLPKESDGYWFNLTVATNWEWIAEYFTNDYTLKRPLFKYESVAATPSEALALLAIKLFEEGVLK